MIKQLSIFLKNQPGELARIMNILNKGQVRVRGMCVTETSENGILRMTADKPEAGQACLGKEGISSTLSRVLAVQVGQERGLEGLFTILNEKDLNVEYLYTLAPGLVILKIEDAKQAARVLDEAGYALLREEELTDGGRA